ncbi:neural Wiskott-Aldrich syndrome protein-like [Arapaima gigas]
MCEYHDSFADGSSADGSDDKSQTYSRWVMQTALASAVAQVYEARAEPGGQGTTWTLKDCGVVCLVRDMSRQSHFLRLYNLKRGRLLWEQELYTTFTYSAPRPFFHSFPADDCQVALNFADEEEAERFRCAVQMRLEHIKGKGHGIRNCMVRMESLDSSCDR